MSKIKGIASFKFDYIKLIFLCLNLDTAVFDNTFVLNHNFRKIKRQHGISEKNNRFLLLQKCY